MTKKKDAPAPAITEPKLERPIRPIEPYPPTGLIEFSKFPPGSEDFIQAQAANTVIENDYNERMKQFKLDLEAWEVSRKAYIGYNEGRKVGDSLGSSDPVTLRNLDVRNSQASTETKPKRVKTAKASVQEAVAAHNLGEPITETSVSQGRPEPVAELTNGQDTPEALGYTRAENEAQWKLW